MNRLAKILNYFLDLRFRIQHGKDKYSLNLGSRYLVIQKNNRIINEIELNQLKSVTPRVKHGIIYEHVELVIELEQKDTCYIIPEETINFEVLSDFLVHNKYLNKDWYHRLYSNNPQ